jgi:hypothetical protein
MCLMIYRVTLSADERLVLKKVISAGKAGGMRIRNAMLLRALDEDSGEVRLSEAEISSAFSITTRSLYNLRKRFVLDGFETALYGKPRETGPTPLKIDGVAEANLSLLACSNPPPGRGVWTIQLLSDRFVELGFCGEVSRETVRKTLKKMNLSLGKENTT